MYWSKRVSKIFSVEHVPLWKDQVERGCKELGCDNVTLLAFPPDQAAFDSMGCTPRGIYEPGVLPAWCSPNFDPVRFAAGFSPVSAQFVGSLSG